MSDIRVLVEIAESGYNCSYYHVPTDKALGEVALSIIKEFDKGNYLPKTEPPTVDNPGFTKEEISTLPASLQNDALGKLEDYKRGLRYHQEAMDEWTLVKAARGGNGKAAWTYLEHYGDGISKYIDGYQLVTFKDYKDWKKECHP